MPVVPLPAAAAFDPSVDVVDTYAYGCGACSGGTAAGGTVPGGVAGSTVPGGIVDDDATYFYGTLPLTVVDQLLASPVDETRSPLGALFASGYFGGIYLRGTLAGPTPADDRSPFAPVLDAIGGATQSGLDGVVVDLVATAEQGGDDQVREVAAGWSSALAAIAGYNRGYLEVALEHPPTGLAEPVTADCPSLFDCRSAELPLAALDALAPQREALLDPPSPSWTVAAAVVNAIGELSVPGGRQVWNGLLAGASFDPAAYATVVRLSVGFLEVTDAALLAVLAGPTGGDIALARRGLLATAALVTWAGSYFLGLASPLPPTALPHLTGH